MDASTLIAFFENNKWQKYKSFVEDFTEFTLKHAHGNEKELEKALEFFVDLINRIEFEQKRLDTLKGDAND